MSKETIEVREEREVTMLTLRIPYKDVPSLLNILYDGIHHSESEEDELVAEDLLHEVNEAMKDYNDQLRQSR